MTATEKISQMSPDQKRLLLQQLLNERAGASRRTPLSYAQQRLWFLDRLQPGSATYNIPTVLRLKGRLDAAAMTRGLRRIIERHEALRTTFHAGADDSPFQKINPTPEFTIGVKDFSRVAAPVREEQARTTINTLVRKPFDLSSDLMLRANLLRLREDEHLLVLVTHHIASDEWSLRVLFEEWAALYREEISGRASELGELPLQYAAYAQWQRDQLKGDLLEEQLGYWRKKLKGPLPTLELPADYARPQTPEHKGQSCQWALSGEHYERLAALGREHGATPFMTLAAVFTVLMHRYTQQDDLVFGTPIAGRTMLETEKLIGFFVNTLVFRAKVAPEQTFAEVLATVRETTLGAYANQELPFDKLVEEIKPERSSSSNPLVQIAFSLETDLFKPNIFEGLEAELEEAETGTSKFDLTFVVRQGGGAPSVFAEYDTALFKAGTIQRLLTHYATLIEAILEGPKTAISKLRILPEAERTKIVRDWNQTRTDYPATECIHQLFESQVAKTPEAIALEYGEEALSYRELNVRANQLAHRLRKLRAGRNTLVGVYLERSPWMILSFVGILKAGAAYVPLDLSYPKERLAFMAEDAQMPVIITTSSLAGDLPPNQAKIICIDSEWTDIATEPRLLPPNHATPDSLAYMIYTSGSTGRPKGVPVPHKAVVRLVRETNYVRITPNDRIAQASNASFDAATFEIWGALLNSARVTGISKDTTLSPHDFVQQLRQKQVTTLFVTTALFNQLAREVPGAFRTLKHVLFGGEAVDPKWVRSVLECHPPERLLHVYGPTESTTFSSWYLIQEVEEGAATIPIGKPISNTQLYVLDSHRQPVPIGVPGELYVGGDGLAHGYYNRPELTAEKFVESEVETGSRLYRTGDLVRFLDTGDVEFIGRIDHQVKIRGLRIELGEIESVLARHENVSNCVVLAREDAPGEKRLVGYVIAKNAPAPTPSELRAFLKKELPDFMVPGAWVYMESFPLTPNEKVDRRALPAPDENRVIEKTFIAPRCHTEQQLAKVWEKVLGVQPIGVADNFFDLGGHSLLAVKLFSQIERVFGKRLPLATLFRAPTIEQMAKVFREEPQEKSWSTLVDIQPQGTRNPFYWVHSLGGDGGGGFFYYRKLSELLGPDQPSFGIRSPQQPFNRIEEMAEFYIKELKKAQPHGPYNLGGFCFGGVVAYEMACQLIKQGDEIAVLAVLESAPPNLENRQGMSATNAVRSLENLFENVKDFVHHKPEEQLQMLKRKTKKLKAKLLGQPAQSATTQEAPAPKLSEVLDMTNYPKDYVLYAETHWGALTKFHPSEFPGDIHVFRARKQGLSNFSHTLGWDALVKGEVVVDVIPGTHESMLQEPNVQILAAQLRSYLEAKNPA